MPLGGGGSEGEGPQGEGRGEEGAAGVSARAPGAVELLLGFSMDCKVNQARRGLCGGGDSLEYDAEGAIFVVFLLGVLWISSFWVSRVRHAAVCLSSKLPARLTSIFSGL